MTDQTQTRVPRFYLTPAGPCPYLPGRRERKVFTKLDGPMPGALHDALAQSGFRRSQTIAYKPVCDGCTACVSVRVAAEDFVWTHNRRRILRRNADLVRQIQPPLARREQFALLRTYLDSRHAGAGMDGINLFEYAAMVEDTPVATHLCEYHLSAETRTDLVACALTDFLADGVSMVYSFFHPGLDRRSLGTYMILDHIRLAREMLLPYVYLGYWVRDCAKMRYKARFAPLEVLTAEGWIAKETLA